MSDPSPTPPPMVEAEVEIERLRKRMGRLRRLCGEAANLLGDLDYWHGGRRLWGDERNNVRDLHARLKREADKADQCTD